MDTPKTFWICGKYLGNAEKHATWMFEGIFDSEQKAIDACIEENHFIGSAILNESHANKEDMVWPGCYYPLLEESPSTK